MLTADHQLNGISTSATKIFEVKDLEKKFLQRWPIYKLDLVQRL